MERWFCLYNKGVRFQHKLTDIGNIAQIVEQLTQSQQSSYLWAHSGGRLHICEGVVTGLDQENKLLTFRVSNAPSLNALVKLPFINLFHEGLQFIFRSPIEGHNSQQIKIKFPSSVLKLSQSLGDPKTPNNDLDDEDMVLIAQLKNFMSLDKKEIKNATTNYSFAKGPEVKETAGAFAFSNRGKVNESELEKNVSGGNRMRITLSIPPSSEKMVYQLLDVHTQYVSFQTGNKGGLKEGGTIVIHDIYDNPLPNPLKAKIVSIEKPSEYAKYWKINASFKVKEKKAPSSEVGLKRLLGDDLYSHEVVYPLQDFNTSQLIFSEKNANEFSRGDKLLISSLYGEPLKTPLLAAIVDFNSVQDEQRQIILEFLKLP